MLWISSTAEMCCVLTCSYMQAKLASMLGSAQIPSAACVAYALDLLIMSAKRFQCRFPIDWFSAWLVQLAGS